MGREPLLVRVVVPPLVVVTVLAGVRRSACEEPPFVAAPCWFERATGDFLFDLSVYRWRAFEHALLLTLFAVDTHIARSAFAVLFVTAVLASIPNTTLTGEQIA